MDRSESSEAFESSSPGPSNVPRIIKEIEVHVRWMISRDMPEVLEIENESFEFPWSEDDFIRCLRQRNCIGMVGVHEDKVVGFMIYELHRSQLRILNFAAKAECRRQKVGTAMVNKLLSKLSAQRRNRITLEIRETNLAAQQFFKAKGFKCISLLHDFYEDTDEDAYIFNYSHESAASKYAPNNRISSNAGS